MAVELTFQAPSLTAGRLLETLVDASDGALRGGAAFGFATRDGVQLLFGNREFRQFLEATDGFELVVGIDAITNIAALDKISALATQGLRARAFWHQRQPLLSTPRSPGSGVSAE